MRRALAIAIVSTVIGVALGSALLHRGYSSWRAGGESADTRLEHFVRPIMATPIELVLPGEHRALAEGVFHIFEQVDAEMSEWKPSSPLSAINRAAGTAAVVAVPAALAEAIAQGVQFGRLTDGAFDISWAALWGLWDFKAQPPRVPTASEIAQRLPLVDYRAIELDLAHHTVRLPRHGMAIGLGGIAKGIALDQAAAFLRAHGTTSFLLSAGGEITAGGKRPDGQPWRVGVRNPRAGNNATVGTLILEDQTAATSGDYERFFVLDGMRYHHILDPRNGRPARAGLHSATVISTSATRADALSTALIILGPQRALALIRRLPNAEAVLIDNHGTISATEGARFSQR